MSLIPAYPKFRRFLDAESLEPTLGWGLRMAIATTVPLIWGISTGHEAQAEWIILTADCIGWVALKGTYEQRMRVLTGGVALALIFCTLGSISASLWLSIPLMIVVAFIAGLFKNLGERGSGLSICVYLMYLISNAHPVTGKALEERLFWILVGGTWNTLISIAAFFFTPSQQPYRRSVALIWKAAAALASNVGKGWDGKSIRSSARDIYLKEKDVRSAIDSSFTFHERMAHQVPAKGKQEYQMAQTRKAAALVAAHISAIHDEAELLTMRSLDPALRNHLQELIKALENCAGRASIYVLSLRGEEELLLENRLERLRSAITQLQEYKGAQPASVSRIIRRILQLAARSQRLIERSMEFLEELEERPDFRSYSLIKTVLVLHPRHWWRNIRLLFNIDTHTFRYALRTALAAALALFIYKWFKIEHGYWLPFTVIIVLQPYFGATLRKAFDRIVGTMAGGLAGGVLLLLPTGLHLKEVMMFISAIGMIYFFRRRYTISAFFITLNLVLLFAVSEELNRSLIVVRALTTLGGAAIAIVAGFALLPTWDKKYLPRHIRSALHCNEEYFTKTLLVRGADVPWTKYKRAAETANSNAFDSFSRFMQEYHRDSRASYRVYYNLITHNVRVTRELNNLHLEQETAEKEEPVMSPNPRQALLLEECANWFRKIAVRIQEPESAVLPEATIAVGPPMNEVYLERLAAELKILYEGLAAMPGNG